MFRLMNCFSVSVSCLFFVSYIQLLILELDTARATFTDEKVVRHRRNLRQGTSKQGRNTFGNNIDGDIDHAENDSRSLIVGGQRATDFPRSIVFLSDRVDSLQCGGTLISPTVVLAAGHCEISLVTEAVFLRFTSADKKQKEIRIKATQEILHPKYNRKNLENDVMLVVLESSPNEIDGVEVSPPIVPYMKLHSPGDQSLDEMLNEIQNNSVRSLLSFSGGFSSFGKKPPPATTDLQLKALGWGHTADGEFGNPSNFLKEVDLNWVRNEDCEKAKESDYVNYNNRITHDMMCTWRSGMDTCHGDSGGPIVVDNPNYNKDEENAEFEFMQVGIISWGEDCADHVFPGVASRVSVAYDWIRDRVCSIDGEAAPSYLKCDDEHTFSPAPSTSPTTSDDKLAAEIRNEALAMVNDASAGPISRMEEPMKIEVAVEIFLDVYAFETSWTLIEVDTKATVNHVPYRSYKYENKIREVFELTVGNSYQFIIYDQFGDGIKSDGSYRIFIVDDSQYESVGKILLEDDGEFGSKRIQSFQVPMYSIPTLVPRKAEKFKERVRHRVGQVREGFLP